MTKSFTMDSSNTCIETFTGKCVDLAHLQQEDVDIDDIGHALGNLCRFGGHCNEFYSVAEHSINVSQITKWLLIQPRIANSKLDFPSPYIVQLLALLHDAQEAYLGDVVRPLKHLMCHALPPGMHALHCNISEAIRMKYKLNKYHEPALRSFLELADDITLGMEAHVLMRSRGKEWNFPKTTSDYIEEAWKSAHLFCISITSYPPAEASRRFRTMFDSLYEKCFFT